MENIITCLLIVLYLLIGLEISLMVQKTFYSKTTQKLKLHEYGILIMFWPTFLLLTLLDCCLKTKNK